MPTGIQPRGQSAEVNARQMAVDPAGSLRKMVQSTLRVELRTEPREVASSPSRRLSLVLKRWHEVEPIQMFDQ